MTVSDEIRDPMGWIVAGTAAGVGAVVLAPALGAMAIAAGLGIGAVVLGTKVAVGSGRQQPSRRALPEADLPKPPRGSQQAILLRRADRALDRLQELVDRTGSGWFRERIGDVDDQAIAVVDSMSELAGRVTVLQRSLTEASPKMLRAEEARLRQQLGQTADPNLRAERERTLQALTDQLVAVDRIAALNETMLSRMQGAAIGLEGLATRAGELVAIGEDTVGQEHAQQVLGDLTSDLDTLRQGLAEAQDAARRLE